MEDAEPQPPARGPDHTDLFDWKKGPPWEEGPRYSWKENFPLKPVIRARRRILGASPLEAESESESDAESEADSDAESEADSDAESEAQADAEGPAPPEGE